MTNFHPPAPFLGPAGKVSLGALCDVNGVANDDRDAPVSGPLWNRESGKELRLRKFEGQWKTAAAVVRV